MKQRRRVHTETGWEVYAPGLTDTLLRVKKRYGDIPLYITENGAAFYDPPTAEGPIEDPLRVRYLRDHLRAAAKAASQGVDLRGYFVWSLMDNLEWAHGYSKRFGIVHVDYGTQRRTPKASARFYSEVIRSHGAVLNTRGKEPPSALRPEGRSRRARAAASASAPAGRARSRRASGRPRGS